MSASALMEEKEAVGHPDKVFGLDRLYGKYADYSYLNQLQEDPESEKYGCSAFLTLLLMPTAPNKTSRQVLYGHYVPVAPTPLPEPMLIAFSNPLAQELGLSEEDCNDPRFAAFFSGNLSVLNTGEIFCFAVCLTL